MRDYKFGNYITALRKKCGYTQYELGKLVGVSDKAVSKWENGTAKPSIDILINLSEILKVNVEDLLSCSKAVNNNINNKEEANKLYTKLLDKLYDLYGYEIPIEIWDLYLEERNELDRNQDLIFVFNMISNINDELDDVNILLNVPSTLITYLLGLTLSNPLPPHYYCPTCKKIVFIKNEVEGLDLKKKICSCNTLMKSDGHNLPFELNKTLYTNYEGVQILVSLDNKDKITSKIIDNINKYSYVVRNFRYDSYLCTEIRYNTIYNQDYVEQIKYDISEEDFDNLVYSKEEDKYLNYLRECFTITVTSEKYLNLNKVKINKLHYKLNEINFDIKTDELLSNIFNYYDDIRVNSFITGYKPNNYNKLIKCLSLHYNHYDESYFNYIIEELSKDNNKINDLITTKCDLFNNLIKYEDIKEYKSVINQFTNIIRKGTYALNQQYMTYDLTILTDKLNNINDVSKIKFLIFKSRVIDDLILILLK